MTKDQIVFFALCKEVKRRQDVENNKVNHLINSQNLFGNVNSDYSKTQVLNVPMNQIYAIMYKLEKQGLVQVVVKKRAIRGRTVTDTYFQLAQKGINYIKNLKGGE